MVDIINHKIAQGTEGYFLSVDVGDGWKIAKIVADEGGD